MSENLYLINVILHDLFENITRIDYVPLEYREEIKKSLIKAYKDGNQEFEKIHKKLKRLEQLEKENETLKKHYNLLDSTIESDDRFIFELLQENKVLKDKNDYLKFLIKKYFVYDGRNHIIKKSVYNFDYESIKDVLKDE